MWPPCCLRRAKTLASTTGCTVQKAGDILDRRGWDLDNAALRLLDAGMGRGNRPFQARPGRWQNESVSGQLIHQCAQQPLTCTGGGVMVEFDAMTCDSHAWTNRQAACRQGQQRYFNTGVAHTGTPYAVEDLHKCFSSMQSFAETVLPGNKHLDASPTTAGSARPVPDHKRDRGHWP